jgi:hypothetical protein
MRDLANLDKKLMTTRELADALGCPVKTILNNANRAIPNKVIENGKPTLWNESEVTVIRKSLEKHHNKSLESTFKVENSATELENDLIIARAMAILNERIGRVEKEKEALQIELDEAKEWWSVKRVLIDTGVEYPWRPLREYSRKNGFPVEKTFDKNYGEVNAYHIDVWNAVYGVEL